MVESIAIMEYLTGRHGPTPLAPAPYDPSFAAYRQFLHPGEAGLVILMMPVVVSRFIAPEAERDNWGAIWCPKSFQKRLKLVSQRLADSPYLARTTGRDAYKRAMERSHEGVGASIVGILSDKSSVGSAIHDAARG